MAGTGIDCPGMHEMSPLVKSKGPRLITSDRASHQASVIRRDPGGNIHSNNICTIQIPAAVNSLDTLCGFPLQIS